MQASRVAILIIAANEEEAHNIARRLLDEKKAACVNILPRVESFFWWQSKLESAEESLLIVKTGASFLPGIIETVKKIHSYEVPEIIALPIIGGSEDYLKWLDSVVGS